mmetsp:Transcript_9717/g.36460  ORF Transcript_9717/g.36460 Transcript_9717/m.36460 type:complete len:164 (-) Transcript_9717:829-1320(-)
MLRAFVLCGLFFTARAFTPQQRVFSGVHVRGGDDAGFPEDDAPDALFGSQGGGKMPDLPTTPEAMAEELKNIESYTKAFENLMRSGEFDEFFNDDEKIEEARLAIVNNPMMMEMVNQIPGANTDALKDPVAWREQMKQAKELFDMQKSLFNKGDSPPDDLDED